MPRIAPFAPPLALALLGILLAPTSVAAQTADPAAGRSADTPASAGEWTTLGLLRVRDMTPFGLNRLDLLPAHAVDLPPGSFGFEVNLTYQNTWVMSKNVENLLRADGAQRRRIGPQEVAAILALPGDAYLVDGEFGLVDTTLHYRMTERFGLYVQLPWYFFGGGFLDKTIEDFHGAAGLSNGGRDLGRRDDWVIVAGIGEGEFVVTEAPSADFGDPVLGLRWTAFERPRRWNVVVEGAFKLVVRDRRRLVSTGTTDYGLQVSLQRFFRRNALYLSLAQVWVSSPERAFADDEWIPTGVAGWETRLTRRVNLVLQLYASRSTIRETPLEELAADKLQATLGVQWRRGDTALRLGLTENLANFDNTPDVGVTFSVGRIFGADRAP